MADPPRYPDTTDDIDVGRDRGSNRTRSRWMSVVGIVIAIGVVLLLVILHLTGILVPGGH